MNVCKFCGGIDIVSKNDVDFECHDCGESHAMPKTQSDGATASYYELPEGAEELQALISHRDMNAQMGEIFRAVYRYGMVEHSPKLRDAKKIKFYIEAEIERLEKLNA